MESLDLWLGGQIWIVIICSTCVKTQEDNHWTRDTFLLAIKLNEVGPSKEQYIFPTTLKIFLIDILFKIFFIVICNIFFIFFINLIYFQNIWFWWLIILFINIPKKKKSSNFVRMVFSISCAFFPSIKSLKNKSSSLLFIF